MVTGHSSMPCWGSCLLLLLTPAPFAASHIRTSSLLAIALLQTKHSIDRTHQPLLSIPPVCFVPTPLHLFLGISNRIILDAFSELLDKERVETALNSISTVDSAGCSGKSDLYDLNGPEHRFLGAAAAVRVR